MTIKQITAYDRNWRPHQIEIERWNGAWRVTVEGKFFGMYDTKREADDEVEDLLYGGKFITHEEEGAC